LSQTARRTRPGISLALDDWHQLRQFSVLPLPLAKGEGQPPATALMPPDRMRVPAIRVAGDGWPPPSALRGLSINTSRRAAVVGMASLQDSGQEAFKMIRAPR